MSDLSSAGPSGREYQQALQAFRAEFAQQVPARVAEAHGRLQACRGDPGNEALLRELHRCVHKLAGSAGTFGMARLGDDARAIELRIETLLAQGQRTGADFEALIPGVEALAPL